jgi:hypothetical protein
MLPPHNTKIALYLLMKSQLLGIVKCGGIYRLFCFDDLRIDPSSLSIYGEHWSLEFDEFVEEARIFNHEKSEDIMLFYPESQSQPMLEIAFNEAEKIAMGTMSELVKMFRPVQYGRIEND